MPKNKIETFQENREKQNQLVLQYAGKELKRFYSLDGQVYRDGTLPGRVKELIGLVSSFVLRCDDCVLYHLTQCSKAGISDEELEEALAIGVMVGGSITIPHLRRAFQAWEELKKAKSPNKKEES